MTVQELIDSLSKMDRAAQVHFAYDYGDRPHSMVAPAVEDVTSNFVEYSDYHSMDKLAEDEWESGVSAKARKVVVLR